MSTNPDCFFQKCPDFITIFMICHKKVKNFLITPCKINTVELYSAIAKAVCASLAQLVEQLICNHQVAGSSPTAGSTLFGVAVCAAEFVPPDTKLRMNS